MMCSKRFASSMKFASLALMTLANGQSCVDIGGTCDDTGIVLELECCESDVVVCKDSVCEQVIDDEDPVCGDEKINQIGEECDPPNGTTCDDDCKKIKPRRPRRVKKYRHHRNEECCDCSNVICERYVRECC